MVSSWVGPPTPTGPAFCIIIAIQPEVSPWYAGDGRKISEKPKEKKKLNQAPVFFKSLWRNQSSWTGSQGPPLPAPSQGQTSAPVPTVGRASTFALVLPLSPPHWEGPSGQWTELAALGQWFPSPRTSLRLGLRHSLPPGPPGGGVPRRGLLPPGKGPGAHRAWTQLQVSRGRGRTGLWALLPETDLERTTLHHLGRHGAERRAGRPPCQSTCRGYYEGGFGLGGCAGYPPSQVEQGPCPSSLQ